MRILSLLSAVALSLLAALPAQGAAPSRAQLAQFDQFVSQKMAREKIPGLSIGFIHGDQVWTKGYGYADLENKTPATAASSYRLASVTKPMTAAAVLLLAEQGKVDLDAEVQTYVPYFPRKPFPVTVRQLLGHLGGINAYVDSKAEQHFKEHKDTRQSIAVFEGFDLVAEPGTRFRYTSYGYNLLGAVIEGASGQSYADYMKAALWGPLGMGATRLDDPYDLIAQRVRGYQLAGKDLKHAEFVDISSRFSAGGTRSTVADMLKFGQGVSQGRILSPASRALLFTSMATRGGELTGYGMGWLTDPVDGKFVVSHDGVQPETSTYLFSFPSRKLTIAVAANLQRIDTSEFAQRLFETVTGEAWELNPYVREPARRPYAQAMQAIFNEGRAYFERAGQAYPGDAQALDEAFGFINDHANPAAFQRDAPAAQQAIAAARHPKGGMRLVRVGSFMAQALKADLGRYSRSGAIGFFRDYIALYRKDGSIAPERRFNAAFEDTVFALAAGWRSAASTAASAYPNRVAALDTAAMDFLAQGKAPQALRAARLALDYYPDLDAAHTLHGVVAILAGDRAAGEQALRKSIALNPSGSASPGALNTRAYKASAMGGGSDEYGSKILQGAIAVHPNDANLRDSLGDFYVRQGMKEEAIVAYQGALAIQPNYPNAAAAKDIIASLRRQ